MLLTLGTPLLQGYQRWMHTYFPRWYYPLLYALVNFYDVSYAEAARIATRAQPSIGCL